MSPQAHTPHPVCRLAAAVSLCLAFAFISIIGPVHEAKADGSAQAFVQKVSDTAISDLTKPGISDTDRVKRMRKLLIDTFDAQEVAKFVLGFYSRRATPTEFEEFMKLYEIYVAHNYAGLFKHYNGQKVEMQRERVQANGEVVVFGVIHQVSGPDINLEMRVHKVGNTYKALDLKLEGISMPLTHRKQFASVIAQRGNKVSALNQALKKATDRLEAETSSTQ
jgi:phospholipid transport system substrate-binding protein